MRSKYINPFTDYGFKRLFGEEGNKNLLVAFLNDMLPIKDKIIKVDFNKNEAQGDTAASKKEEELQTHFDKWLYFLKNLDSFNSIPQILNEPIFIEAFRSAEIANFTEEEYEVYERSLKIMRDNINVINTAREEGREEGAILSRREDIVDDTLEEKIKAANSENLNIIILQNAL